jgi:toxin YoeB
VKVTFSSRAWAEYLLWQKSDPKLLDKVNSLIEECSRDPFRGTGKPEPLGGNL